jgi:hypothetical protein
MLSTKLKEAAGNSADATLYVDDVFSTYLYTGNSSTQTITNGIDLAGKGGLVWLKGRSLAVPNNLWDSARGITNGPLESDNTNQAYSNTPRTITSFNSDGFSMQDDSETFGENVSTRTQVSWTFREAAKFFDVVTYTGTGSARTIAHSLGVAPGMVIVKRTDTTSNWQVYHRGLTSAAYSIQLNLTAAQASAPTVWNSTAPTSSVFSVGADATVNASGGTYVAYLYAHDTSSTGIIQCGSYTGNGSGNSVTLGFEPQYIIAKAVTTTGNWEIIDTMRRFNINNPNEILRANLANELSYGFYFVPNSTGFKSYSVMNTAGVTYIYMAIRMPNKPPTSGTQVYAPVAFTGNGSTTTGQFITSGFPVDLAIQMFRNQNYGDFLVDRLRGLTAPAVTGNPDLSTNSTSAENVAGNLFSGDSNTGIKNYGHSGSVTLVNWLFKRAPGFFDEVCWTAISNAWTSAHNLGVSPELIISKNRTGTATYWYVYLSSFLDTKKYLLLNTTDAVAINGTNIWGLSSTSVSGYSDTANGTGVSYLFATLAGISKVGSYTGNGTGQAIACGFGSGGARFVLIKRTDSTGNWYTFDSARGLTSGSSPYLLLNSTAAEVTGNNGVYASTGGFTLGATAITTTNIATATYIFLAIA